MGLSAYVSALNCVQLVKEETTVTTVAAPAPAGQFAEYEPLEAGYYLAELRDVAEMDKEPDLYNKEAYKEFRFRWELTLPDGTQREYTTWAKAILAHNEKAWLTKLMVALGVCDGTTTQVWPPEDWVGRKVRINIEEQLKPDGSVKNRTAGYAPATRPKVGAPKAGPVAPPAPPIEDGPDTVPF